MHSPDAGLDATALMARALALASQGRGAVRGNPMVGAVLVGPGPDGRECVLGEGWHRLWGAAHAEVEALTDAERRWPALADRPLSDCTMYVSLEPCCHHGKTPPCTDLLIRRRVGRVVAAMVDPDLRVAGKGLAALQAAGIAVDCGLLEAEARYLNAGFVKVKEAGRPFVSLKVAVSLDGKLAAADGSARWISNAAARRGAMALRERHDAVLVGARTWVADKPRLNVRDPESGEQAPGFQPWRIVLDGSGRTLALPESFALGTRDDEHTLVLVQAGVLDVVPPLPAGVRVLQLPGTAGRLDVAVILEALVQQGIQSVLVEGGGRVAADFLESGCVDRLHVHTAPIIIGRSGVDAFAVTGGQTLAGALRGLARVELARDNACFELDLQSGGPSCLPV